jgi:hypothetical protein
VKYHILLRLLRIIRAKRVCYAKKRAKAGISVLGITKRKGLVIHK